MNATFYFAQLKPGYPKEGMGLYDRDTGVCKYYSDGGQWFYEMGTGTATFYIADGKLYSPDGTLKESK
jgi:hypothetical protein